MENEESNVQAKPPVENTTETFTADYVRALRAENKAFRVKAQEAETASKTAAEAAAQAARDAEAKIAEAAASNNARLVRAELKAHAIKAGIVDLDGLKLLDTGGIGLNDAGEVEGAEELISKLREAKPYLFADNATRATTTQTQAAPKPAKHAEKTAAEMTPEEYAAAKARLLGGSR